MFDIGFWELTLLAVIGLIVLGPERLPVVARTLGLWVGRAKGYVRSLTDELEREVDVEDIRTQVRRAREQIESDTHSAITPARDALSREEPSVMRDSPESAAESAGDEPATTAPDLPGETSKTAAENDRTE